MIPVITDAAAVVDMKNVLSMQAAKMMCDSSQRHRRVRPVPTRALRNGIRHDGPESESAFASVSLPEGISSGRMILAANETIAFMKRAKVPIRVASTHFLSISSSGRSRCSSKIGLTYNWPI